MGITAFPIKDSLYVNFCLHLPRDLGL
ncbi:hypothetical protein NC653_015932 [Populus alba x Populus x berolinensis]|uniref:Uncharacterized protein n=1 Tax=Populus alba x Populus x berolinensis TaxID=444605 RepID=A0AAD6VZ22_9ROSI|nr:hypothetical protein NC653_015932 [Populus alba x Populus x berolinensis]